MCVAYVYYQPPPVTTNRHLEDEEEDGTHQSAGSAAKRSLSIAANFRCWCFACHLKIFSFYSPKRKKELREENCI